ncbi:hypothetical protein NBZ79_08550 [Sneathiella marina]|uniref:Uncharacterized protein n=1 Tax=Sneathiella marina TaxID=2950108 RepID=A0ABY4W781_9PROT|nr:hypothetical protein [Sneathiella marina]USG63027.1 hypothetical protein NBZ79_08550 [Sneathiella marina]
MPRLQAPNFQKSAFCLSLLLVMGSVSHAIAESCEPEFKIELDKLEIPEERIKNSYTIDIYETSGSRVSRVEGWVDFNDCKGNLVVKFDRSCLFDNSYTTTECTVPGVKKF